MLNASLSRQFILGAIFGAIVTAGMLFVTVNTCANRVAAQAKALEEEKKQVDATASVQDTWRQRLTANR